MVDGTQQLSVEQLAETASLLPPLPQTTSQIINILGDPLFEFRDLIKVIALDPPLTATLLRAANSAKRARTRDVDTIGEAIVRLGSGTVLVMAVAGSARPDVDTDLSLFGLTVDTYWRHCVASVAASEELNSRGIARFGPGFSTAALLHDYGKLIIVRHITTEYRNQFAALDSSSPEYPTIAAEQEVLGVDHAVAGGVVVRYWKLPETIASAIENHHSPKDRDDDLTNGLILANQIALENAGHKDFTEETTENVVNAMQALGVDQETYEGTATESQARFERMIELFA